MSVTNDKCIDLGSDMWLSLADTFKAAMAIDGITDIADQALVYAGFISTMSGQMLAELGPEATRMILDQAKDGCAKCVRSQFSVVPK